MFIYFHITWIWMRWFLLFRLFFFLVNYLLVTCCRSPIVSLENFISLLKFYFIFEYELKPEKITTHHNASTERQKKSKFKSHYISRTLKTSNTYVPTTHSYGSNRFQYVRLSHFAEPINVPTLFMGNDVEV